MSPNCDIIRAMLLKHELEIRKKGDECSRQYAGTGTLKVRRGFGLFIYLIYGN